MLIQRWLSRLIWTKWIYNKLSSDSSSSLQPVLLELIFTYPSSSFFLCPPLWLIFPHSNLRAESLFLFIPSSCMSLFICPLGQLLLDLEINSFKSAFCEYTWPSCSLIDCPPALGSFGLYTHECFHSAVFTHLIWISQINATASAQCIRVNVNCISFCGASEQPW